jgi:flagellar export protein FliJ
VGFRFPMASVLRWREGIEKKEELALQQVQFEVNRVQKRIDEIAEEIAKARREREEALQSWTQANELQGMQDEMNAAADARQILIETLATLKKQKEVQMALYRAARMNRRMLTDLEKRQRETWEHEQVRADQKRLDDVFTSRLIRG